MSPFSLGHAIKSRPGTPCPNQGCATHISELCSMREELEQRLVRPVPGWTRTTASFLRQGWSDWYGAKRTIDSQRAAVRVLLLDELGFAERAKFLEETMQRLAEADCPGLCRPLDFAVEDTSHRAWYALEADFPMRTLEDHALSGIRRHEAMELIASLAHTMNRAHAAGLLVRPEPACILMTPTGPQMLLNLSERRFLYGLSLGRLQAAPGQTERSRPFEELKRDWNPSGDQYRLGVISYLLLTAHWTPGIWGWYDSPPSPQQFAPGLPETVSRTLLRALGKLPQDRFPSLDAMVAALREAWGSRAPRGVAEKEE